jgi:acetyl-CoA synthetase
MDQLGELLRARDLLWATREDHEAARARFEWPRPAQFNWALDFFDRVAPAERCALRVVEPNGIVTERSFDDLRRRSDQVATMLRALGVGRGDRVLVMLGNVVPLWEACLAGIKLGAVLIPASTLLTERDVADRIARAGVRAVIAEAALADRFAAVPGDLVRVSVGGPVGGWQAFESSEAASSDFVPDGPTAAQDPLLLYFTSGTTAQPKLVEHTHASYPIGHLSTMYVLGLRPGDVHLNVSSPGWAKHAWSSLFAPWLAEATVLVFNYPRFDARALLEVLVRERVTSLCAPPTVWRMLVQEELGSYAVSLREVLAAGEPCNPEIIDQVRHAWGLTLRDFYGQTELTATIGNSPGLPIKPGSMGCPLPGYDVDLLDDDRPGDEGEICVRLEPRPLGLMTGYRDDPGRTAEVMRGGYYHTGDVATRDRDGYVTYVGRADDVFKAADYRISPFELESALLEHPAVAEAAVVPSPDARRTAVPKAFVVLAAGWPASAETARSIFEHSRERLAPFQRLRRLEFAELPKTISGKIRRVELRSAEAERGPDAPRRPNEYAETDVAPPGSGR